jgi:hypothetical protein
VCAIESFLFLTCTNGVGLSLKAVLLSLTY